MNWPLTGILAAIAIAVGIVLLIVYATRRGFVNRDLPDTIASAEVPTGGPAPVAEPPQRPRTLGAVGAAILIVGLALGLVTAVTGWGGAGSGTTGTDCAQSWNGCPQVTAPAQSVEPLPTVVP
jgi:hypothetical protein